MAVTTLKAVRDDAAKTTKGVTTEVVTITPTMADAWLENNLNNRKVARSVVDKYARDMSEGRWKFTGDAIRFDVEGTILDGQHRLMAVVKSGVPLTAVVVYGLPTSTREVIDTGKARTTSDVVGMAGVSNSVRVVGAARMLMIYKLDAWKNKPTLSSSEILNVVRAHPQLVTSAGTLPNIPRGVPLMAMITTHYIGKFLLGEAAKADQFYTTLRTGVPAYDGDPIHIMRERFIGYQGAEGRISYEVAAWTVFNCWNLFAAGEKSLRIKWCKSSIDIAGLKRAKI